MAKEKQYLFSMKLKTPAITITRSGRGYNYDAYLRLEQRNGVPGWVLDIDQTPAKWWISSLLVDWDTGKLRVFQEGQIMYLDYGQEWYLSNFMEVLREALQNI